MEFFRFVQTVGVSESVDAHSSLYTGQDIPQTSQVVSSRLEPPEPSPLVTEPPHGCGEAAEASTQPLQERLLNRLPLQPIPNIRWTCIDCRGQYTVLGGHNGYFALFSRLSAVSVVSFSALFQLPNTTSSITKIRLLAFPFALVAGTQKGDLWLIELYEQDSAADKSKIEGEFYCLHHETSHSPISAIACVYSDCTTALPLGGHDAKVGWTKPYILHLLIGDYKGRVQYLSVSFGSPMNSLQANGRRVLEERLLLTHEVGPVGALEVFSVANGLVLRERRLSSNEELFVIVSGTSRNAIVYLDYTAHCSLRMREFHFIGSKGHHGFYTATGIVSAHSPSTSLVAPQGEPHRYGFDGRIQICAARPGGRLWLSNRWGFVQSTLKLSLPHPKEAPSRLQLGYLLPLWDEQILSWTTDTRFETTPTDTVVENSADTGIPKEPLRFKGHKSLIALCNLSNVTAYCLLTVEGRILDVAFDFVWDQMMILQQSTLDIEGYADEAVEGLDQRFSMNPQELSTPPNLLYNVECIVLKRTKTEILSVLMHSLVAAESAILTPLCHTPLCHTPLSTPAVVPIKGPMAQLLGLTIPSGSTEHLGYFHWFHGALEAMFEHVLTAAFFEEWDVSGLFPFVKSVCSGSSHWVDVDNVVDIVTRGQADAVRHIESHTMHSFLSFLTPLGTFLASVWERLIASAAFEAVHKSMYAVRYLINLCESILLHKEYPNFQNPLRNFPLVGNSTIQHSTALYLSPGMSKKVISTVKPTPLSLEAVTSPLTAAVDGWPRAMDLYCRVEATQRLSPSAFGTLCASSLHSPMKLPCLKFVYVLYEALEFLLEWPASTWNHKDGFDYSGLGYGQVPLVLEREASTQIEDSAVIEPIQVDYEHFLGHSATLTDTEVVKDLATPGFHEWERPFAIDSSRSSIMGAAVAPAEESEAFSVLYLNRVSEGNPSSSSLDEGEWISSKSHDDGSMRISLEQTALPQPYRLLEFSMMEPTAELLQVARDAASWWVGQSDKLASQTIRATTDVAYQTIATTGKLYNTAYEELTEPNAPLFSLDRSTCLPELTEGQNSVEAPVLPYVLPHNSLLRNSQRLEETAELLKLQETSNPSHGSLCMQPRCNAADRDTPAAPCAFNDDEACGTIGNTFEAAVNEMTPPHGDIIQVVASTGNCKAFSVTESTSEAKQMRLRSIENGHIYDTYLAKSSKEAVKAQRTEAKRGEHYTHLGSSAVNEPLLWMVIVLCVCHIYERLCTIRQIHLDAIKNFAGWVTVETLLPFHWPSIQLEGADCLRSAPFAANIQNDTAKDTLTAGTSSSHRGEALLSMLRSLQVSMKGLLVGICTLHEQPDGEDKVFRDSRGSNLHPEEMEGADISIRASDMYAFLKGFQSLWNEQMALLFCSYFFTDSLHQLLSTASSEEHFQNHYKEDLKRAICSVFTISNGIGWTKVCDYLEKTWKMLCFVPMQMPHWEELQRNLYTIHDFNVFELHTALKLAIASCWKVQNFTAKQLHGCCPKIVYLIEILKNGCNNTSNTMSPCTLEVASSISQTEETEDSCETTSSTCPALPTLFLLSSNVIEAFILRFATIAFPAVLPHNIFRWIMECEEPPSCTAFLAAERIPIKMCEIFPKAYMATTSTITATKVEFLKRYLLGILSQCVHLECFDEIMMAAASLSLIFKRSSHTREVLPSFASLLPCHEVAVQRIQKHENNVESSSHLFHNIKSTIKDFSNDVLLNFTQFNIPAAIDMSDYCVNYTRNVFHPNNFLCGNLGIAPDSGEFLLKVLWFCDELLVMGDDVSRFRKEKSQISLNSIISDSSAMDLAICVYSVYPRLIFFMRCGYAYGFYRLLNQILVLLNKIPHSSLQMIPTLLLGITRSQKEQMCNKAPSGGWTLSLPFQSLTKFLFPSSLLLGELERDASVDFHLFLLVSSKFLIASLAQTSLTAVISYSQYQTESRVYTEPAANKDECVTNASLKISQDRFTSFYLENEEELAASFKLPQACQFQEQANAVSFDPLPGWCYDVLDCFERLCFVLGRLDQRSGFSEAAKTEDQSDLEYKMSHSAVSYAPEISEQGYLWDTVYSMLVAGLCPCSEFVSEHNSYSVIPTDSGAYRLSHCRGLVIQLGLQLAKRIGLKFIEIPPPEYLSELLKSALNFSENLFPACETYFHPSKNENTENLESLDLIKNSSTVLETVDLMRRLLIE